MIVQYLSKLASTKIVLASSSPRRLNILQNIGLDVEIIPSTFEETLNSHNFINAGEFAIATAKGKAEEVAERLSKSGVEANIIIGADTCISLQGKIYGKPKDIQDAHDMLSRFSGCSHEVLTGVYVILHFGDMSSNFHFFESTTVNFSEITEEVINAYISTGEPMDKAGGYGIQALGAMLVESIEGDYFNVMGFPVHRFCQHLAPFLKSAQF